MVLSFVVPFSYPAYVNNSISFGVIGLYMAGFAIIVNVVYWVMQQCFFNDETPKFLFEQNQPELVRSTSIPS